MRPLYLLVALTAASAATPTVEIKVDQAGYLPSAAKIAFVAAKAPAADFTVRNVKDNSVAFRGKLSAPVDDVDSGDRVQAADFTALQKTGQYYLDVAGVGRSWDFAVAPDV